MTPSEKKATKNEQEAMRLVNRVINEPFNDEMKLESEIASALSEAERRGFKRAKELAKQAMAPMLRDMISRGKAWDLIDGIKFHDEVSDGVRGGDIDP